MLFRLFRLPILLAVAFIAGVLYERSHEGQECRTDTGGTLSAPADCK